MWYILYPCGWKIISSYPLMLDILYPCGWKTIPSSSTYVRYFVPLQLENHTFIIHLCKIFCTPVVGKSYLQQPLMWDILYPGGLLKLAEKRKTTMLKAETTRLKECRDDEVWRKVTERCDGGLMRKRSARECEEDGKQGLLDDDGRGLNLCVVPSLVEPGVR